MLITSKWAHACPMLGAVALSFLAVACGKGYSSDPAPSDDALTGGQSLMPRVIRTPLTGADSCGAAPITAESLDAPLMISDTTVGQTDDVDLPDDNNNASACTAATACVGDGPMGAGGRGTVWAGCGTGPDRTYRFQVDTACTLEITMQPAAADLGVYLFMGDCMSELSSCACVSDFALDGQLETISGIEALPNVDYYVIVDGYTSPMSATTSAGAYDLTITRTEGNCNFIQPCGNDAINVGEACDDGNTESCDGCNATCTVEETGCGDGVLCGAEDCDDGNDRSGDGCSATCSEETVSSGDSGVTSGDAAAGPSTDGGAVSVGGSGAASGGQGDGDGGASQPGGNTEADGSVAATGGSTGSMGKGGQVKGGGGTAGEAQAVAAAPSTEGDSGGCSIGPARSADRSSNGLGLTVLGLIALCATRRRSAALYPLGLPLEGGRGS